MQDFDQTQTTPNLDGRFFNPPKHKSLLMYAT